MAVTKKNAVFWDVTPSGSCKNRCFRRMYHLHHQGDKNRQTSNISCKYHLHSVFRFLVTANIVPSSPNSCNPDDGSHTFLQYFSSYKSHMA
jgi:hypothetical protein